MISRGHQLVQLALTNCKYNTHDQNIEGQEAKINIISQHILVKEHVTSTLQNAECNSKDNCPKQDNQICHPFITLDAKYRNIIVPGTSKKQDLPNMSDVELEEQGNANNDPGECNADNSLKEGNQIFKSSIALDSGYRDIVIGPGTSKKDFSSDEEPEDLNDPFEASSSSYKPSDTSDAEPEDTDTENNNQRTQKKRKLEEDKVAKAETTKKKRRRKANKELWKQSVNKKLRLSGQKYINRSGKEVQEKKPQIVDCTKCRFKCQEKIPENQREALCQEYYNLADDTRQKMHLSSLMQNVLVSKKKSSPKTKNRETSRIFFLKDSNRVSQRVCRIFFCKTFAISHRVIENCAKNCSKDSGLYIGYDKRIHTRPPHATPEEAKTFVRQHIDSFPKVESHYCRKDTQKHYLSPELNISLMYRLYATDFCTQKKLRPVSLFVYQKIFHEYEPRLGFYTPKKDQCSQCNAYKQAKDKSSIIEEYNKHKQREKQSMEMKEEDKKRSAAEKGHTFRSISFDLQAILSIPHAGDSQIYYRHKLNVYNFTIYDASTSDGYCYVWDETHGRKGSTEIGTCILKYLFDLPATVTHVATFSDTCGGQNRNKYVAAAMLFAVKNIEHLKVIDLKFMESGHSYLEADSMHACIERAKRHKQIYSTREWCLLISTARIKPRPYMVDNLKYDVFYDLQQLATETLINTTQNTKKEKVHWLNIKWLRFEKKKTFCYTI